MAKSLIIKGYTSEEIKAEFKKHPKYKVGIKLHVLYQLSSLKNIILSKILSDFGYNTAIWTGVLYKN